MVKQSVKQKKQAINQIWLSFIFMVVILGNFFTVAGITYFYESNGKSDIIPLYESDSNSEFAHVNYGLSYPINPDKDAFSNYTSGYFHTETIPPHYRFSYEKNPAYTGNNTWGIAINTTTGALSNALARIVFDIPDCKNWIITDIDINTTLSSDIDNRLLVAITNFKNPTEITEHLGTGLYNVVQPAITSLDLHIDVTTVKALKIHSDSQERPHNSLDIVISDDSSDGMTGFAFQISVIISGYQAGGWDLETSLLISTTLWNILIILVIIYSLDMFDLGGFVKTLKKGGR